MASVWLVIVLWIFINVSIKATEASCARVHTPASLVLAGSPVSVSCSIEDDCLLTKGKDFCVVWMINKHFAPSNLSYPESDRTYGVLIPSLQDTSTEIVCLVCVKDDCQIVDGLTVKTGYPPPVPTNLTCVLNITSVERLRCQWDPEEEKTSLPTRYVLQTIRYGSEKTQHEVPPGNNFFEILRDSFGLFSELEISVTAVNDLGNTSSAPLKLKPMKKAMFDPPVITRIEARSFGCLEYSWSLAETQTWVQLTLNLQLRVKMGNTQLDKESIYKRKPNSKAVVCGLLHGMTYNTTIRVSYSSGDWSEWSDPKTATTLMKAPTGRLDTWLRVNDQAALELYWKPSQQFRANSLNLSYTVESKEPKKTLCVTQESYCFFNLTKRVKKVYLRATNAVGSSDYTEVPVCQRKGLVSVSNFSVCPQSETSLLLAWKGPVSASVAAYVLEWRCLCEETAAPLLFTLVSKNKSSAIVTGLSPYKPYEISIYPKYVGGIGRPATLTAYSSENAPSAVPELNAEEIRNSHVKFYWDEIPLEQRNGIIQGYTIYFWHKVDNIQVIKTETTNVVVKDLQPLTNYFALLSVHTMAGSLNGSVVTLTTGHIEGLEMVLFVIPACIGLSLLVIIVFTCFGKQERVKMCLWPIIPDPANSSIRRWTTADSLQGMPPFKEDKDPVLVYLSHFSILDLPEKEQFKGEYVKENQWPHEIDSHDEIHNSIQPCGSYDKESVPYATVVFGGPYQSHSASLPAYVRSESTQPLLAGDEPGSPPPYENLSPGRGACKVNHFTAFPRNSTESMENEELWEEFPMLRTLEVRVSEQI